MRRQTSISRSQKRRQKNQIQKSHASLTAVIALLPIVLVALLLIVHFTPQNAQADENASSEPTYKYYTSIQVESGDSLWKIARKYQTKEYSNIFSYISEIKEINHLSSDQVTEGMYLCIPYYTKEYKS